MKKERRTNLTVTILSLSLLTVMAGAAVAPALDTIREYFSDVDKTLVQLIISIPALFIFITNMFFCRSVQEIQIKNTAPCRAGAVYGGRLRRRTFQ